MEHVTQQKQSLDHRDRMIASHAVEDFERIRESTRRKQEAKENDIRERYHWGRTVHDALEKSDYGDGVAKKIANEVDHTVQYVHNHARFYKRVLEMWPDDEADGYVALCEEEDRNLSWRQARDWADEQSKEGDDTQKSGTKAEEVEQQRLRVERKIEKLEEEATQLWKQSQQARGELTDHDFEQVKGVVVAAKQKIDETDPDDVPDAEPEQHRQEIEPWRRWVETKGCIVPGCDTPFNGPTAHHLDRGGHGTKGSDTLTVCLCDPHHQILHDMPEREFWDMHNVNPWRVAAEWQSEVLDAIGDLATVLNATP